MESLLQDVRYGVRTLRKSPAFTAVALIVLAVGIGANTAMFSVLNAVLLRPLPYRDSARLIMIWQSFPAMGGGWARVGETTLDYLDYRNRTRVFESVAGYASDSYNLTGGSEPERIDAARVTANLFSTVGVQPAVGRGFSEQEDQ